MGFFSWLWEGVKSFFVAFWRTINRFFTALVNFVKNIVSYFRGLILNKQKDKPFVADLSKLKDLIKDAPIRNAGIFEGVYDEETDEIKHTQIVEANNLDSETKNLLAGDPLVVLI